MENLIEKAKKDGKYKGRKEVKVDDFADHYITRAGGA